MNYGSIHKDTAAGRLYRALKAQPNVMFSAYDLAQRVDTTCISTRISEVRKQVHDGERVVQDRRVVNGKTRWYYGLEVQTTGDKSC